MLTKGSLENLYKKVSKTVRLSNSVKVYVNDDSSSSSAVDRLDTIRITRCTLVFKTTPIHGKKNDVRGQTVY